MRYYFLFICFLPFILSAQFSEKFFDEKIADDLYQPVGVLIDPEDRIYVWEKGGTMKLIDVESGNSEIVLDISEKVASWGDQGMMCVAFDPDYIFNHYIYVSYAMDRYYLLNHDKPGYNPDSTIIKQATIGRISRFTLNESFDQVIPDSEHILIGHDFSDGVPISADFHGLGSIVFGDDGSLLFSVGDGGNDDEDEPDQDHFFADQAIEDGIMRPKEFVGPYRSQLPDALNGKILRIDARTGEAIPSNPFYNPEKPDSPISKVYALGFRNPFAFIQIEGTGAIEPQSGDPGDLFIGDVGGGAWEELNFANESGMNFGWPSFEGYLTQWPYHYQLKKENLDAPNPYGSSCENEHFIFQDLISQERIDGEYFFENPCKPKVEIPSDVLTFVHTPPVISWSNKQWNNPPRAMVKSLVSDDGEIREQQALLTGQVAENFSGYSAMPGFWYKDGVYPDSLKNSVFVSDFSGWIKAFVFKNEILTQVIPIKDDIKGVVRIAQHPSDGTIYYVDIEEGELHRLIFDGNPRPLADIQSSINYGISPLQVDFVGEGSFDPKGENLEFEWNFGDGEYSSEINPSHQFLSGNNEPKEFPVSLTVTDEIGQYNTATTVVSVNNTPPKVKIIGASDEDKYSLSGTSYLNLISDIQDKEESSENLKVTWEQFLHHNFHYHLENNEYHTNFLAVLDPLGCKDETYWYRLKVTVEDSYGLKASDEIELFPDCSSEKIEMNWLAERVNEESIELNWEMLNTYAGQVIIERFDYLGNFLILDTISINGTTGTWKDDEPITGKNTYRLRFYNQGETSHYSTFHTVAFPYELYVKLYPNPVKDMLNIYLVGSVWEDVSLKIYDESGAKHMETTLPVGEIPESFVWDVAELNSGVYILHVIINGEVFSEKFMKVKL